MGIAGDSTQNNNIGGSDGIDFKVYFTAELGLSWSDVHESVQNTIQYES